MTAVGLTGMVVVVTGAAGAIGSATAQRLGAEGARVVVADLDVAGAVSVAGAMTGSGVDAVAVGVDVTDEDSVRSMLDTAVEAFGGLDALHNNAAGTSPELAGRDTHPEAMPQELWDRTLAVNLRGPMLGIKHAVPLLRARGGGAIVNTSSVAASFGDLSYTAYGASKGGLESLTRFAATRYGRDGIRCNAVAPGLVRKERPHVDDARISVYARHHPLGLGEPEDVAAAVAFLVSHDARFITGQVLAVDGGLSCHLPTYADFVDQRWEL